MDVLFCGGMVADVLRKHLEVVRSLLMLLAHVAGPTKSKRLKTSTDLLKSCLQMLRVSSTCCKRRSSESLQIPASCLPAGTKKCHQKISYPPSKRCPLGNNRSWNTRLEEQFFRKDPPEHTGTKQLIVTVGVDCKCLKYVAIVYRQVVAS